MAEQQVVIASPTIENQQALGSQIEETVTMSTYQIKKAFQQQRADLMTEYERLKGGSITLDVELSVISTRLRDKNAKPPDRYGCPNPGIYETPHCHWRRRYLFSR